VTSGALIGDDLCGVVVSAFGKLGVTVPVHHARIVRQRRGDEQVVALERIGQALAMHHKTAQEHGRHAWGTRELPARERVQHLPQDLPARGERRIVYGVAAQFV
jgi:hypothetical protein